MPLPIKHDDAYRLCGGSAGQKIQSMLYSKFLNIQKARYGSYADRERQYLLGMGCTADRSRADMWQEYMSMFPARKWWGDANSVAEVAAAIGGGWRRGGQLDGLTGSVEVKATVTRA